MKMRIEIDESLDEEEIIIKCRQLNKGIMDIQQAITNVLGSEQKLILEKEGKEYLIPVDDILFFETQTKKVFVHTKGEVYSSRYKLYELEKLLPYTFLRVSKSTILNIRQIYSISWNITSSSEVEFLHTHKKVFVSRTYYKILKERLENREEFGGN